MMLVLMPPNQRLLHSHTYVFRCISVRPWHRVLFRPEYLADGVATPVHGPARLYITHQHW